MHRIARWTFLILTLLALAAGGAYLYLRQSLPQTEGQLSLSGLSGPVEVLRDRHAIPHIYARTMEDAQFALGFVHAQDRLWQMEMNRRIAAGRLAEVLGPRALETDRFMRTLGVRRVAEANLARYDEPTRRQLEAYAAGVNAFLETRPVLPPEFWLLGFAPEPWSAVDSVAWTKMMAWDLGQNWRSEVLRLQLAQRLPVARIQEFLAPYPGDPTLPLPDLRKFYEGLERPPIQVGQPQSAGEPLYLSGLGASNSWVVSGQRSANGKPLLANDPHLGLVAPPVWYFAHLRAEQGASGPSAGPALEVIGATLPGVPGVILGRNERIAWGFTSTGPDVQDLYLEKLDASLASREELIRVKGEADVRITVRSSRHGPILSDVVPSAGEAVPRGYALALAWTALAEDDLTVQGGARLQAARNWSEFLAAMRDLHAPQQNVMYADVDGNIGFVAAGRVPVRKPDNALRGLAPAPGWDPRYDWAGYVPFEELPRAFNPAGGRLITANQKIVPPGYPHHITSEWQPPYRFSRIEQLLAVSNAHSLSTFAAIQMDAVSLAVRDLLPHFLEAKAKSPEGEESLKKLRAWDGTMSMERVEPLLMVAWWREFARLLYADETGEAFLPNWSARAVFITNVLEDRGGQARWCDDVRTPPTESCGELLAEALESALRDLRQRYGADMARWNWGTAHTAESRHRPLSQHAWLSRLFDIRVPSPGDAYTVNVGRSDFNDPARPFANRHAASLRALYDLGDPQASLFIHSGGQSGNLLSPHYRAFAEPWAQGQYVPMLTDRSRLEAEGVQRLVLTPRK